MTWQVMNYVVNALRKTGNVAKFSNSGFIINNNHVFCLMNDYEVIYLAIREREDCVYGKCEYKVLWLTK